MRTDEFTRQLRRMSGTQILEVAAELRGMFGSAAGEVAWWRATVAVERTLRRERRSRVGGRAAHEATLAVMTAARRSGVTDAHRDEVTLVARAAGDVARALAAGPAGEIHVAELLRPWRPVILAPAA